MTDAFAPSPRPANRLIPSQFPPIGLFDTVATGADLSSVMELVGWTNDRLVAERIDRLPRGEWVYGTPNSSIVMAAFLHVAPGGMRFNGPELGAWYAADDIRTAAAEVGHHLRREAAARNAATMSRTYRAYIATLLGDYGRLLAGERADLVLTDPPFNVRVDGNISGLGRVRHAEFAMASGEMSEAEFTSFLSTFLGCTKAHSRDGAILFVFMDWRHLFELTCAGREQGLAAKNLIVWAKDNAGMGTFYRSRHELVFVFKNGDAAHTNTFELGQHGRYRTNVWEYAGVNTFRAGRLDELAMHPTVKPVAMLADAIRDVTKRGAIVLDPFAGSGSTLIAAEKTGRQARCIEYEPKYCDVIVRRWQAYIGKAAMFDGTDLSFEDFEGARSSSAADRPATLLPTAAPAGELPQ